MSAGTKRVRALWEALGLELPPRRRSHLTRFFAGLKPLQPVAYASLLRAIARAVLEADLVPVTRDVRHDPVELIAAALEVSIERWDAAHDGFAYDLAARIAAFELLFGLRVTRERWEAALAAVGGPVEDQARVSTVGMRDRARVEVSAAATAKRDHGEAALAEIVVLGAPHGTSRRIDARTAKAIPLARGMSLVRAAEFAEALVVFEEILALVPGHTLALQQASRCCVECNAMSQAEAYSRRASGRVVRSNWTDVRRTATASPAGGRRQAPRGGS